MLGYTHTPRQIPPGRLSPPGRPRLDRTPAPPPADTRPGRHHRPPDTTGYGVNKWAVRMHTCVFFFAYWAVNIGWETSSLFDEKNPKPMTSKILKVIVMVVNQPMKSAMCFISSYGILDFTLKFWCCRASSSYFFLFFSAYSYFLSNFLLFFLFFGHFTYNKQIFVRDLNTLSLFKYVVYRVH